MKWYMKKYYKTKAEANKARLERERVTGWFGILHVWKMPKGTRHHGEFAVCSELEYLNTY